MTMERYRNESSDPKYNAQRNLSGRTHYCDDDTLKAFGSRILLTRITDDGLLFALVESVIMTAPGIEPRQRGYRHCIFDVFGQCLSRPELAECVRTRKQAEKAMWDSLNAIDATAHTRKAIERRKAAFLSEMERFAKSL